MDMKWNQWTLKHTAVSLIIFLMGLNCVLNPFQLEDIALRLSCVALLMIGFWIFEILPMPVVALFPLVLFPLLGIDSLSKTAAPYADPIIFLFMGGFFLALAIEKWGLHKRIAVNILSLTGFNGNRILMGFMVSTFLISMWISNTATTLMMFPIALSVLKVMQHQGRKEDFLKLQTALMVSIAYASNFGGLATIIGTPPNTAYVGYVYQELQVQLSFLQWMVVCFPIAVIIMILVYLVFTRWMFKNELHSTPEAKDYILRMKSVLGAWSVSEKRVFYLFALTAFAWITKDFWVYLTKWDISDTGIAMMCAILLFVIPSGTISVDESEEDMPATSSQSLLNWKDTQKMSWGILLLFGGGMTLARSLESVGILKRIGNFISQHAPDQLFLSILLVAVISILLSEVMSNIAQVLVMAPILTSVSQSMELNPLLFGIPMTLAASCAGMLPMGTPPNAIVFSSGKIPLRSMLKAGAVVNLISVLVITAMCYWLLPLIKLN